MSSSAMKESSGKAGEDGSSRQTWLDVMQLPTDEMIDVDFTLRRPPESLFLNRFFSGHESRPAGNGSIPWTSNAINFKDFPVLGSDVDRTKRPTKRTDVRFRAYGTDFRSEIQKDRMRLSNHRQIRLLERGRTLNPGIEIQVPDGFFGLVNCMNPPGCVCATDVLCSGPVDVRPYLVNISGAALEIPASTLQIYIHVLPKMIPEPWQTVNLPAPHVEDAYFDLRARRSFFLPPRSISYLKFNTIHLCPEKTHTALILPRRQLTQRKLLLEATVWAPGTMPVVRAINVSTDPIHIVDRTKMAKVLFTVPGITTFSPALTSLVTSLNIPRVDVSLTRTTPTYRQKTTSSCRSLPRDSTTVPLSSDHPSQ